MEDDTPMGAECQTCGMINACVCEQEKEFVWTTAEGERIPVSKLADNHLRNIHRMLRQTIENTKHYEGVVGTFWEPRGEGAQQAFEQEYEQQLQYDLAARARLRPIRDEMTRRGLAPLPLKEPYKKLPEPVEVEQVPGGGTIARFK